MGGRRKVGQHDKSYVSKPDVGRDRKIRLLLKPQEVIGSCYGSELIDPTLPRKTSKQDNRVSVLKPTQVGR